MYDYNNKAMKNKSKKQFLIWSQNWVFSATLTMHLGCKLPCFLSFQKLDYLPKDFFPGLLLSKY